jgi:hypothetical protein
MNESAEAQAAPATITLAAEFAHSGVGPVLQQLDNELIGLGSVDIHLKARKAATR